MKKIFLFFGILLMLTAAACTAPAVETASIDNRLSDIDDYKQSIPTPVPLTERLGDVGLTDREHFRGVPYGATQQDVMNAESLPLVETYTDALDYGSTFVYSQQMKPTYWFNENGQLCRGSYYMKSKTVAPPLSDIYTILGDAYGESLEYNFYDFDGELLSYTYEQGIQAITEGTAFYYEWYSYDGIDIELYVEKAEESTPDTTVYDIYIHFTNNTYY